MYRAGIFASILGVLGGFVGVWLGVQVFERGHTETAGIHALVHEELDLSRSQISRIDQLESYFSVHRQILETDMAGYRHDLGLALLRDGELSDEVTSSAASLHESMGQLQIETLRHILAMREELNATQRAVFDEKLAQAFDDED